MTKHQTVAIFMAPLLALGGYILAGIYTDSDDISKDKKLVLTGTCKPVQDQCEVLGIGLKLNLNFDAAPSYQRLLPITLTSEKNSLDDVSMSLMIDGKEMPPVKMIQGGDKKLWRANLMPFATVTKDNLTVRLAVSYKSALHFAEFPINY
jgi:hypothetical protein